MDKSSTKLFLLVLLLVFAAGIQFGEAKRELRGIIGKRCNTKEDCSPLPNGCVCRNNICVCDTLSTFRFEGLEPGASIGVEGLEPGTSVEGLEPGAIIGVEGLELGASIEGLEPGASIGI